MPNPCFNVKPCFKKYMHSSKVIKGYMEVTNITGIAGPLRKAIIKKIQAIPFAKPFNNPYILPLAESSGLKPSNINAINPATSTPMLE